MRKVASIAVDLEGLVIKYDNGDFTTIELASGMHIYGPNRHDGLQLVMTIGEEAIDEELQDMVEIGVIDIGKE